MFTVMITHKFQECDRTNANGNQWTDIEGKNNQNLYSQHLKMVNRKIKYTLSVAKT